MTQFNRIMLIPPSPPPPYPQHPHPHPHPYPDPDPDIHPDPDPRPPMIEDNYQYRIISCSITILSAILFTLSYIGYNFPGIRIISIVVGIMALILFFYIFYYGCLYLN